MAYILSFLCYDLHFTGITFVSKLCSESLFTAVLGRFALSPSSQNRPIDPSPIAIYRTPPITESRRTHSVDSNPDYNLSQSDPPENLQHAAKLPTGAGARERLRWRMQVLPTERCSTAPLLHRVHIICVITVRRPIIGHIKQPLIAAIHLVRCDRQHRHHQITIIGGRRQKKTDE